MGKPDPGLVGNNGGGTRSALALSVLPRSDLVLSVTLSGAAGDTSLTRTFVAGTSFVTLTLPFAAFANGEAIAARSTGSATDSTIRHPTPAV